MTKSSKHPLASLAKKNTSSTTEWRKVTDGLSSKNISIGAFNVNSSISVVNTKNGTKYKCTKIVEVWCDEINVANAVKEYFDDCDKELSLILKVTPEPGKWLQYTNFKKNKDNTANNNDNNENKEEEFPI